MTQQPEVLTEMPPAPQIAEAREGDVIQINPSRMRQFGGVLLVVIATNELAVRGVCVVDDSERRDHRVAHGDYAIIGRASWIP